MWLERKESGRESVNFKVRLDMCSSVREGKDSDNMRHRVG